ncbi:MAG: RlmE family RNA methyltransferase [Deltaproteobacteria bacterium]|nr:RlmE family RNA methyltransferase [Deltaproteobacteria bacterium]
MARHRKHRRNPYGQPDAMSRAARAAGYTARSVFKLEQIDQRVSLLRQGQRVVDLGAAPGSWSAYAATRIGPSGRLVAIDLKPLKQSLPDRCQVITGDAFDEELLAAGPVAELCPYDVVLSDMAPNTTGDKGTDQIRSHQLFMRALEWASQVLRPGGSFVGKIFMGGDFQQARDAVRTRFATVRVIRPKATRGVSYEIFLVGLDLEDQADRTD